MSRMQHHKGKARRRGWHRTGAGPDRAFARAARAIDRALAKVAPMCEPEASQLDRWDGVR